MIEMRNIRQCVFLICIFLFACSTKDTDTITSIAKPEANRFTPVGITPAGSLDEPMVFEVLPDESVIIIERGGNIKKWDAATESIKTIGNIPVFTHSEQGLVGMTLDPDFQTNHWIYLYYADASVSKFFLTRWDLINDSLIQESKKYNKGTADKSFIDGQLLSFIWFIEMLKQQAEAFGIDIKELRLDDVNAEKDIPYYID